ncbi:MAG: nucleotidyltransferase family protein [Myxococcales bacterium]|nr:nucleotidyltransferase family protein [Myxococcales bacterium]
MIDAPSDTDGRRLVALAADAAVLPTVASRAAAADPELDHELREVRESTAVTNALLLADLGTLTGVLSAAGVSVIALKGAALLASQVVAPEARHLDDIDVLVPPALAERAETALLDAGFSRAPRWDRPGVDGRPISERGRVEAHTQAVLVSPTGGLVDLHFSLPDSKLAFDDLADDCDTRPDGLLVPRPALLLGQLCDHVFNHHQARPRYLPRHIADVRALIVDSRTSAADLRAATRWSSAAAVFASLSLVAAAAGRLPAPVARATLAHVLPDPRYERAYELGWNARLAWGRLRHDAVRRPDLVFRKLVPARAYLEDRYGLAPDAPATPVVLRRLWSLDWLRGEDA